MEKPLFSLLSEIKKVKNGSRVSRFFRIIFEQKKVKKILGANIALMVLATSFIPKDTLGNEEPETSIVVEANLSLVTKKGIQYPVEKIIITQGFRLFHPGIDLDGITGDTIKPIKAGKVEAVSKSKYAYGNAVIVNHGNNLSSLYAHLSKLEVEEGQEVTINTKVGEMGATGRAYGDHLHLEVRDHGVPINPTSILPFPRM